MVMLENNPVLRERVLGVTAVSAILIGGAMGFDAMITSGWQLGGGNSVRANYAMTPQQYFDDIGRDWTATPPQRVQLASLTPESNSPGLPSENLDGDANATLAIAPMPPTPLVVDHSTPAAQPPEQSTQETQSESDQRFAAIESDIQQATNAIAPDAAPEKTPDEENAWPPS